MTTFTERNHEADVERHQEEQRALAHAWARQFTSLEEQESMEDLMARDEWAEAVDFIADQMTNDDNTTEWLRGRCEGMTPDAIRNLDPYELSVKFEQSRWEEA